MSKKKVDVAIVGGGLAGGLIALELHRQDPEFKFALIEQGTVLGGNHRWSWFTSDLDEYGVRLMDCFDQARWDAGYDVRFADHSRTLETGYRSLSSADFHAALIRLFPGCAVMLECSAETLDAEGVTLATGERIDARIVIDCRPFEPSEHLQGGWQVFLGKHLQLDQPHGLTKPTIMDADVDQNAPYGNGGAYRFVYTLPISETEIFIEDTYYADEPRFDRDLLSARVDSYARRHNWLGEVVAEETGILPVVTGGDFDAHRESIRIPGVAIAGARGGFSHPLTSYTVPIAVRNALDIAYHADTLLWDGETLRGMQLAAIVEQDAKAHWRQTGFYRMLGTMLFGAAEPDKRDRIFAQFYRRPLALIERFYRANSTFGDKARILRGRPPVSVVKALRALRSRGKPLVLEKPE